MGTSEELQCHPMNTVRWHLGRKTPLKKIAIPRSHLTLVTSSCQGSDTFLYKKAKEEYSSLGAPSTLQDFFPPYIALTNLCSLWEEK